MEKKYIYSTGLWASILLLLSVSGFAIGIILGLLGLDILSDYTSYISSFFIAPAFIAVMLSNHYLASTEKKILSHFSVICAVIYCIFVWFVYYLYLTVFRDDRMILEGDLLKIFKFTPGSAFFAIDMLGYALLSLAAFFGAFIFNSKNRIEKWLKRLFLFNGLFFISSIIFPVIYYPENFYGQETADLEGSIGYIVWSILFIVISILLIIFYKSSKKKEEI